MIKMTWINDGPDVEFKRAIVFAMLMQDIEDKAPSYVLEKWAAVNSTDKRFVDMIHQMLHPSNKAKLRSYLAKWNHEWDVGD